MGTFQRTEQHSALLGLECIPTIMELLDLLALPIYCVLLGKETADGAISHIEREFLKT